MNRLKSWALRLKREVGVLARVYKSPALPFKSKLLLALTLGYALSPVDLIPDFIPVIGYLDDLIILPLLVSLTLRSLPPELLAEARRSTDEEASASPRMAGKIAGAVIITIWIAVAVLFVLGIYQAITPRHAEGL